MSTQTADVLGVPAPTAAEEEPANALERRLVFWLTNVSHAANHFQNQMIAVMYPLIMADLGIGYAAIGVLTAIRTFFGSATQVGFGFLTPFASRSHLLGIGNIVLAVGTFLSGMATNFATLVAARTIAATGSSAQHPVGSSLLSGYFPRTRGTVLAMNTSISGIGTLVAPGAATVMLLVMGWREVFFIAAFLSLAMGVAYFLFRDRDTTVGAQPASKKARLSQGKESYLRVIRNKNMMVISLVMMVGAAGRGDLTPAFLGAHIVNDLGLGLAFAGIGLTLIQVGGIVGPIGLGWLSDRISRKAVIQASLLLSALATWWLAAEHAFIRGWLISNGLMDEGTADMANQGVFIGVFVLNLLIYGAFTHSRGTLTQALVADSVADADRDAAFSAYYTIGFISTPFWALLSGAMMAAWGFSVAFAVLAFTYLIGMLLMFMVEDVRPDDWAYAPRTTNTSA